MKKITSLLLVVSCLLLCLTACAATPQELITEATENYKNLTAMAARMEMNISATVAGEKTEIPVIMDYAIKDAKAENPTMYMKMEMGAGDSKINVETYMEDNWSYIRQGQTTYKVTKDVLDDEADAYTDLFNGTVNDIPADLYDTATSVSNEDGSQTITLAIPEAVFEELYDDMLEMITDTLSANADIDMSISNCKTEITVKGGQLVSYNVFYNMTMQMDDVSVTATVSAKLSITQTGDAVTVTPLEGYQNFPDYSNYLK